MFETIFEVVLLQKVEAVGGIVGLNFDLCLLSFGI